MPLLGQASGGFTESSSALRILHVGIRNTIGVLTADSFTQTNPPTAELTTSDQVDTTKLGVLSGSIAFARPDEGSNYIGGPVAKAVKNNGHHPLGVFINSANGNSFENTPGTASGKGPYVSSQGTYGNSLFETYTGGAQAITYAVGDMLVSSPNGYLTNDTTALNAGGSSFLKDNSGAGVFAGADGASDIIIGVVKMPADSVQGELVYDQRI